MMWPSYGAVRFHELVIDNGLCLSSPDLPHHFFSYLCSVMVGGRRVGRLAMKDTRSSRVQAGLLYEAHVNCHSARLTVTASLFRLLMLKGL